MSAHRVAARRPPGGRVTSLLRIIGTLGVVAAAVAGAQLVSGTTASADPVSSDWSRLRMCESSDGYDTDTGNGYYGAYQFDLATWHSVGGVGYPHQAARSEQDYRALYLYRMRGWQPWECGTKLALIEDRDARSKRMPSYAESAYIGGMSVTAPAWPGTVFSYGDCDPGLRTWQLRMNAYDYGFDGTGCYYDKTRRAVLDLQRANGIKDSGLLGPTTWEAAWTGRPPR